MRLKASVVVCSIVAMVGAAQAAVVQYSDKAAFLADSGAVVAAAFPGGTAASVGTSYTVGDLTFTAKYTMWTGDWSARLSGGELAINDMENLNVAIVSPKMMGAFGFDFVEPQNDPNVNAPFVDSTFEVKLLAGSTEVGAFRFNAPNDQAYFVGAISGQAFNRVEIHEVEGGIENEFYGSFYTTAVPLPAAAWAAMPLLGAIAGIKALRRRSA